ncbi:acetamidase/formamidase family protein [Haliangium sp.]|uniref:acetamidase/formamidase family protein n=1 Tax=Haliangium sp. TaxID=2663208 RepID=UPI003D11E6BE
MHHELETSTYVHTFGRHPGGLTLHSGDCVTARTVDSSGRDHEGAQVCRRGNPLTGPFVVVEARAGDALAVELEELSVSRSFGLSAGSVLPELVPAREVHAVPDFSLVGWQLEDGYARALDLGLDLAVPITPMLGCIGVGPRHEQHISSTAAGPHGGNMDCRHLTAGATVYLPVFVAGAYLCLGDGHAAQGDGELNGSGIEVPLRVRFRVRVERGLDIGGPRVELGADILTVGAGRPLERALQHAVSEMLRWLQRGFGMSARDAHLVLSLCAELEIASATAATVVCKIAKQRLPSRVR